MSFMDSKVDFFKGQKTSSWRRTRTIGSSESNYIRGQDFSYMAANNFEFVIGYIFCNKLFKHI